MIEKMKLSIFNELITLAESYMEIYPTIELMPETRRDEFVNLTKSLIAYRKRISMEEIINSLNAIKTTPSPKN